MRPKYESQQDRDGEVHIAKKIAAAAGLFAVKLPASYRLDFAFHESSTSERIRLWAEVKRRHNNHDAYPSYMVSLGKWLAAVEMNRVTGLKVLFGIEYNDGIFILTLTEKALLDMRPFISYAMGGRRDRGDSADIEPVVHVPMNWFKPLVKKAALFSGLRASTAPTARGRDRVDGSGSHRQR